MLVLRWYIAASILLIAPTAALYYLSPEIKRFYEHAIVMHLGFHGFFWVFIALNKAILKHPQLFNPLRIWNSTKMILWGYGVFFIFGGIILLSGFLYMFFMEGKLSGIVMGVICVSWVLAGLNLFLNSLQKED